MALDVAVAIAVAIAAQPAFPELQRAVFRADTEGIGQCC
jgi:hypothetical protein